MAGYKEYKSVSEFPLHTEKLNREQLETAYREIRDSYRSLSVSRGQLVRRQTEAAKKISGMHQTIKQMTTTVAEVQQEKQKLQRTLALNQESRNRLENWGNKLAQEVDDLTQQMSATTRLLGEFETVYEEVKDENGVFSAWHRFSRLLAAAKRLLNR